MAQVNGNQFLPEEIVTLRYYDKKAGQWKESEYPKVGGRLRLAHELNGTMDISTGIIKYDGKLAVVKALCSTDKGSFSGIGMASIEKDEKLAPAILELAETRAIARSLRFAGYGVEYCSAEEVSHLNHENGTSPPAIENDPFGNQDDGIYCPATPMDMQTHADGNGSGGSNNNSSSISSDTSTTHTDTNGNGRLSNKQYNYLLTLGTNHGFTRKEMDQKAITMFGTALSYLNVTVQLHSIFALVGLLE